MNGKNKLDYRLYTDGACQPNPGHGGWAFILIGDEVNVVRSGGEKDTTNNRMEMQAVINGLHYFIDNFWTGKETIEIVSDSKYLLNGISIWSDGWQKRGWTKSDGKPVLNPDLWQQLFSLKNRLKPKCTHIKGHAGHEYNEQVDELAVKAAKEAKL